MVHVFWELRTLQPLPADFLYHAVPDACVNLLFNRLDVEVAGITSLHTVATTLNLGTDFHYASVQLFPGVWQGDRDEIQNRYVGTAYWGVLPLVATNRRLAGLGFDEMVPVLAGLVRWCAAHGQAHFTHAFRQAIGFTPGQYRKAFGVRFPQNRPEGDD